MFPALLGAIAPAVIGGIFSSHANKKQNKSNQKQAVHQREIELEDDATRFTRLRDAAVAGGFNPLTALQFGGTTSGFGSGRVANQVFDWGPTASAVMSAAIPEISGQAGVARQREILEQDLLKVQTDALRVQSAATQAANAAQAFAPIGGYSSGGSGGAALAGAAVAAGGTSRNGRPVARPNSQQNQDRVLVYAPNGNPMHVYASTAERLGLSQFSRLTADEYMQFFGEISEVEIALNQDEIRADQARQGLSARDLGRQSTGGGWTGALGSVIGGVLNWSSTLDNITIHNEQSKPLTPQSVQWPSNMMPTLGPVR